MGGDQKIEWADRLPESFEVRSYLLVGYRSGTVEFQNRKREKEMIELGMVPLRCVAFVCSVTQLSFRDRRNYEVA